MASASDDTAVEKQHWHWRNTMRPVRFFNLDARAAFPFLILLVFPRINTFIVTLIITYIFLFLEKKGLTFPAALRALRVWLIGQRRPAWLHEFHRRNRDYIS